MAMLAERKSKQKWSHDPRNTAWSSDTGRFGYQMLKKMGWSAGKGLGASESGSTSHVKVSVKNNNLGVGAKTSQDDNWLSHQDDFNDLLAKLNSTNSDGGSNVDKESKTKNNDMETIARKSKKRVFYQRFIKSKNTSNYSAKDMACIMGQRSKSAPDSPVGLSENEDSDNSCASCPVVSKTSQQGMTTFTSGHSVQEYFAMKMAELKKRQGNGAGEDTSNEKLNVEDCVKDTNNEKLNVEDCVKDTNISVGQEKKKKKRKVDEDGNDDDDLHRTSENDTNVDIILALGNHKDSEKDNETSLDSKRKKKKKKDKRRKLNEGEDGDGSSELNDSKIGVREDTRQVGDNDKNGKGNSEKDEDISSDSKSGKKKKDKKRKVNEDERESSYNLRNKSEERVIMESEQIRQESRKKGKKGKRKDRKRTLDEEDCGQNTSETKLSKKKKKKIELVNVDEEDHKDKERKEQRKNKKKLKQKENSVREAKKEERRKKKKKCKKTK